MKIFALVGVLILSACAPISSAGHGEIVSCSTISTVASSGAELPCLDGSSKISVQSLRGPLIVNVWGSWCGPCKDEIPYFVRFYAKAKEKVDLLGIAGEEAKVSDAKLFVHANAITWPNLIDRKGSTRSDFGMGVPVTWFITSDGTVSYKHVGPVRSVKELEEMTLKYLGINLR